MAWHEAYDDPTSALSARLKLVQAQLAGAIDHVPAGPGPRTECLLAPRGPLP